MHSGTVMVFANGLMLGIVNGGTCLAYCAPVLVPYLVSEAGSSRASAVSLGGFLAGRLAGYLIFAILAWASHVTFVDGLPHQGALFGGAMVVLSLVLIYHGFVARDRGCAARTMDAGKAPQARSTSPWLPAGMGLLTGMNLCPPFLLALVSAAQLSQLWQSLLFFSGFFVGTSAYMVILPWVGIVGRCERIRLVGRLTTGVVGLFNLFSGVLSLATDLR
jgi:hypothetical protein